MKKLLLVLLALSFIFVACSKKAPPNKLHESILGKWWSVSSVGAQRIVIDFGGDGSYKTTVLGQTTNGTYRWLDDSTLELNKSQKVKIAVAPNELTMTIGSEVSKFERENSAGPASSPSPAPGASTSTPPSTSGIIARAALARRISPLLHNAVDVADKFPSDQGTIWAVVTVSNAPADTKIKAVLTAVDTGGASPANSKMGENETTTEGSRNVAFSWTYGSSPPGTYKADIYLNGQLDRTLNFSVAKDVAATSSQTPAATAIGNCPKLPAPNDTPPNFAIGVTMAQGVDGQGRPVNPGRIFAPNSSAIYAVLSAENAPAGSKLVARWFLTDVGAVEPCNSQISSIELNFSGSGKPNFSITPPPGEKWPEGIYRMELYLNGTQTLTTDFAVCDGPCKFEVPISWRM